MFLKEVEDLSVGSARRSRARVSVVNQTLLVKKGNLKRVSRDLDTVTTEWGKR